MPVIQLQKRGGWEIGVYRRLWRALKDLGPTIVHTRNLGVLEAQIAAALAGVPVRIHGEHGRDMYDLDGSRGKYNLFRKSVRPLVHHYTAVSRDLASWLHNGTSAFPQTVSLRFITVSIRSGFIQRAPGSAASDRKASPRKAPSSWALWAVCTQ